MVSASNPTPTPGATAAAAKPPATGGEPVTEDEHQTSTSAHIDHLYTVPPGETRKDIANCQQTLNLIQEAKTAMANKPPPPAAPTTNGTNPVEQAPPGPEVLLANTDPSVLIFEQFQNLHQEMVDVRASINKIRNNNKGGETQSSSTTAAEQAEPDEVLCCDESDHQIKRFFFSPDLTASQILPTDGEKDELRLVRETSCDPKDSIPIQEFIAHELKELQEEHDLVSPVSAKADSSTVIAGGENSVLSKFMDQNHRLTNFNVIQNLVRRMSADNKPSAKNFEDLGELNLYGGALTNSDGKVSRYLNLFVTHQTTLKDAQLKALQKGGGQMFSRALSTSKGSAMDYQGDSSYASSDIVASGAGGFQLRYSVPITELGHLKQVFTETLGMQKLVSIYSRLAAKGERYEVPMDVFLSMVKEELDPSAADSELKMGKIESATMKLYLPTDKILNAPLSPSAALLHARISYMKAHHTDAYRYYHVHHPAVLAIRNGARAAMLGGLEEMALAEANKNRGLSLIDGSRDDPNFKPFVHACSALGVLDPGKSNSVSHLAPAMQVGKMIDPKTGKPVSKKVYYCCDTLDDVVKKVSVELRSGNTNQQNGPLSNEVLNPDEATGPNYTIKKTVPTLKVVVNKPTAKDPNPKPQMYVVDEDFKNQPGAILRQLFVQSHLPPHRCGDGLVEARSYVSQAFLRIWDYSNPNLSRHGLLLKAKRRLEYLDTKSSYVMSRSRKVVNQIVREFWRANGRGQEESTIGMEPAIAERSKRRVAQWARKYYHFGPDPSRNKKSTLKNGELYGGNDNIRVKATGGRSSEYNFNNLNGGSTSKGKRLVRRDLAHLYNDESTQSVYSSSSSFLQEESDAERGGERGDDELTGGENGDSGLPSHLNGESFLEEAEFLDYNQMEALIKKVKHQEQQQLTRNPNSKAPPAPKEAQQIAPSNIREFKAQSSLWGEEYLHHRLRFVRVNEYMVHKSSRDAHALFVRLMAEIEQTFFTADPQYKSNTPVLINDKSALELLHKHADSDFLRHYPELHTKDPITGHPKPTEHWINLKESHISWVAYYQDILDMLRQLWSDPTHNPAGMLQASSNPDECDDVTHDAYVNFAFYQGMASETETGPQVYCCVNGWVAERKIRNVFTIQYADVDGLDSAKNSDPTDLPGVIKGALQAKVENVRCDFATQFRKEVKWNENWKGYKPVPAGFSGMFDEVMGKSGGGVGDIDCCPPPSDSSNGEGKSSSSKQGGGGPKSGKESGGGGANGDVSTSSNAGKSLSSSFIEMDLPEVDMDSEGPEGAEEDFQVNNIRVQKHGRWAGVLNYDVEGNPYSEEIPGAGSDLSASKSSTSSSTTQSESQTLSNLLSQTAQNTFDWGSRPGVEIHKVGALPNAVVFGVGLPVVFIGIGLFIVKCIFNYREGNTISTNLNNKNLKNFQIKSPAKSKSSRVGRNNRGCLSESSGGSSTSSRDFANGGVNLRPKLVDTDSEDKSSASN